MKTAKLCFIVTLLISVVYSNSSTYCRDIRRPLFESFLILVTFIMANCVLKKKLNATNALELGVFMWVFSDSSSF